MPNNLKGYDGFQVLRSVFDVDQNCLRVCIVSGGGGPGPGGPIEVIIDHTTDSIRLGDGTNLVTTTVDGSKVGLDVNIINAPTVNTPLITNITYPVINAEQSHAFNANTKRFMIRFREHGKMNLTFTTGTTGSNFITLRPGTVYSEMDIENTGSLTIYFSVNNTGTVEVLEWS